MAEDKRLLKDEEIKDVNGGSIDTSSSITTTIRHIVGPMFKIHVTASPDLGFKVGETIYIEALNNKYTIGNVDGLNGVKIAILDYGATYSSKTIESKVSK